MIKCINFKGHYEWTERKPRMWTTVFTEEEEKSDIDVQKSEKRTENYIKSVDIRQLIIAANGHFFLLLSSANTESIENF